MKRWRQKNLEFRTHGGRRRGAGRKSTRLRPSVPHRARPEHQKPYPVHVTLRACRRLPSLRKQVVFGALRLALSRTARAWFRIVHYSVQADHVHLLVEADDKTSLSRGLAGAMIRLARAANRVLDRRGSVWSERFHARALKSPKAVRHGIVYVLMNWKKHLSNATSVDPCSSAASFTGWIRPPSVGPPVDQRDMTTGATLGEGRGALVELPTTWLLRTGWKRHGLIAAGERPRSSF